MRAGNRLLQRDGKLRGLTVLPGLAKLSGAGEGFSVLTAVGCLLRHGAMIGIHGHAPHGVCHRAGGAVRLLRRHCLQGERYQQQADEQGA